MGPRAVGPALSTPPEQADRRAVQISGAPSQTIDPKDADVIYIGETCNNLRTLWRRFDRSAFQGKSQHAGGDTYFQVFWGRLRDRLSGWVMDPEGNKVELWQSARRAIEFSRHLEKTERST
jgi:hypothetical protein